MDIPCRTFCLSNIGMFGDAEVFEYIFIHSSPIHKLASVVSILFTIF